MSFWNSMLPRKLCFYADMCCHEHLVVLEHIYLIATFLCRYVLPRTFGCFRTHISYSYVLCRYVLPRTFGCVRTYIMAAMCY